jgi:single-strand DNA-binding protein
MTTNNNLVVLRGTVSGDIVERELPSGSVAVQFDVRTEIGTSAASVNVSWIDPTTDDRSALAVDDPLVVIGSVHRRFFRVGGATQSRTEVLASKVIPARRTRTVRSAVAAATRSLGD